VPGLIGRATEDPAMSTADLTPPGRKQLLDVDELLAFNQRCGTPSGAAPPGCQTSNWCRPSPPRRCATTTYRRAPATSRSSRAARMPARAARRSGRGGWRSHAPTVSRCRHQREREPL